MGNVCVERCYPRSSRWVPLCCDSGAVAVELTSQGDMEKSATSITFGSTSVSSVGTQHSAGVSLWELGSVSEGRTVFPLFPGLQKKGSCEVLSPQGIVMQINPLQGYSFPGLGNMTSYSSECDQDSSSARNTGRKLHVFLGLAHMHFQWTPVLPAQNICLSQVTVLLLLLLIEFKTELDTG